MSEKQESITDADLFYCFVDFEPESPTVHVIPAAVVAKTIKEDHEIWLATPGKKGQKHNDTKMRRIKPSSLSYEAGWLDVYYEAWSQIGEV
jgi:hypothetical protein